MKMFREYYVSKFQKEISESSNEEIYVGLLCFVKDLMEETGYHEGKKKLYYISAEFLIGKLLSNNLINLGVYKKVEKELAEAGILLSEIEQMEPEPSLGNGGLGRLAACFLDSIATLGLCGDGIGLNYHFGLFLQKFENNLQKEYPNDWLKRKSWLRDTGKSYKVDFGNFSLESKLFDMDISGYQSKSNRLHLFDVKTVDEGIVEEGIRFNKKDIAKNLTLFLYPDDSDDDGRMLRIYQQYFMVSNGVQLILEEAKERGADLKRLWEYVVIQINDTHPTLVIPEMIYRLEKEGIEFSEAVEITSKCCAYTNHTILAEALEKWPVSYLEKVVPHMLVIIRKLDEEIKKKYKDESLWIIDKENRVHMAHIDIHYGFSVNGVAALHTEILMKSELNHFYRIYPEKFNNKTNGITFRRWLLHSNRELTDYLISLIGEEFQKDAMELEKLMNFRQDEEVLQNILSIKQKKKKELTKYLKEKEGFILNENSIFDIQIKRLHEYKRQQMNALYIVYKYLDIKKGNIPKTPITCIFGAKAAPAYVIAKDIIHFILCLQKLISQDEEVSKHLNVFMVENYNVTAAQHLIPACDVSEQISLASKEASGTGNMKFMLNGAVTLGTLDGANVEIAELVGTHNIYLFGRHSEEVIRLYDTKEYSPKNIYQKNNETKGLVDFIVSDKMLQIGKKENLERLHKELINKDWFMTLLDLEEYIRVKEQAFRDYENRKEWAEKMLVNIANAGFFSSDRTIEEYNRDIWQL